MRRLILLYFLFCVAVFSAEVVQLEPVVPANADYTSIVTYLTNTDSGAIYNSGFISGDIFGGLATQLLSLPANAASYDTIEELMLDWRLNIRSPPTGEVYNGWSSRINPDGSVDLWNNGIWYDQWSSTSGSNTMALTLRIPLSQLELDGTSGYAPDSDAAIVLSDTQIPAAFVGTSQSGYTNWYSPMHQYVLSYPHGSCYYFDISGDLFIDLYDFVYFSQFWLIDYVIEDLPLFFEYWLTFCD